MGEKYIIPLILSNDKNSESINNNENTNNNQSENNESINNNENAEISNTFDYLESERPPKKQIISGNESYDPTLSQKNEKFYKLLTYTLFF